MNLFKQLKNKGKNKVQNIEGNEIHTHEYTAPKNEAPDAKVVKLLPEQLTGLAEMQTTAIEFYTEYLQKDIKFLDCHLLDELIDKYKSDSNPNKDEVISKQNFIMLVGSAFGNILIDDLNLDWCLYKDEYGEDYAVKHRTHWLFAYPFSTVEKALVEEKSLHEVKLIIMHTISEYDKE